MDLQYSERERRANVSLSLLILVSSVLSLSISPLSVPNVFILLIIPAHCFLSHSNLPDFFCLDTAASLTSLDFLMNYSFINHNDPVYLETIIYVAKCELTTIMIFILPSTEQ